MSQKVSHAPPQGGNEDDMVLLVLGAPIMGEWLKLSAIAVLLSDCVWLPA
jgi:hypothetical protein